MKTVDASYQSIEEGSERKPVELYHVWGQGSGVSWRYTSADETISRGGHDYLPAPVERQPISLGGDLNGTRMSLTIKALATPVVEYIASHPIEDLWIEVKKTFRDDTNTLSIFLGLVKSVSFNGPTASVQCIGIEHLLQVQIPRFRYQSACNNRLFDTRCRVDPNLFSTRDLAVSVSTDGLTLTTTGGTPPAGDVCRRGYALTQGYTVGSTTYSIAGHTRMIVGHTAGTFKLRFRFPSDALKTGGRITVFQGCDLMPQTCRDKFDNLNNFFGMPYIPEKNPVTSL